MKVVTFNLRCCDDPGGNSIDERAPRVKTVLAKYDPDLVGFQEVTPQWMEHLTKDFGDSYEIFNKFRAENEKESPPILWKRDRFTCLDKGWFWFSDTPDAESRGWDTMGCYRICLWARLSDRATGADFVYFNTHYGFGDACQLASGKLLMDRVKAADTRAAVITGDFNMTRESPGYKLLAGSFRDVNAETEKDFRTTYHGYDLNYKDLPIDYCFVTPETVQCVASRRIDDLPDGKFPSDHYGICSEIEIR